MAASTALEALTAELLGDVGILHDKVKALNEALPDVSEALRTAGHDAAKSIEAAGLDTAKVIETAVARAVVDLNRSAVAVGVAKIEAEVGQIAEDVLKKVREEASTTAPSGWKIKVALALSLVVLLGGLAGGIIGAKMFNQATPEVIAAGKDFLQLLQQLDQPTRDKLVSMIVKNHQQ